MDLRSVVRDDFQMKRSSSFRLIAPKLGRHGLNERHSASSTRYHAALRFMVVFDITALGV